MSRNGLFALIASGIGLAFVVAPAGLFPRWIVAVGLVIAYVLLVLSYLPKNNP